jgi:hypothetical protein
VSELILECPSCGMDVEARVVCRKVYADAAMLVRAIEVTA